MKPDSSSTAKSVLAMRRLARDAQEGRVARPPRRSAPAGSPSRSNSSSALRGWPVVEVRVALVVEVVEEAGGRPELLVLAALARVGDASPPRRRARACAASRDCGPLRRRAARPRRASGAMCGRVSEPRPEPARRWPSVPLPRRDPPAGSAHGEVRHRRRLSALRHGRAGRQQERRAAGARRLPAHRGGGRAAQRPAHPRRRGDARAARGPRRAASSGATTTWSRCAPTSVDPHARSTPSWPSASAPRSCSPGRCWRASARADMPPPGRRRDRPPPARPAPRRVPRARAPRSTSTASTDLRAADGLRACDFFMDEPSVMAHRERADGRGADARLHRDPQRRLRAARAGPRAPARCRWARGSRASARTC